MWRLPSPPPFECLTGWLRSASPNELAQFSGQGGSDLAPPIGNLESGQAGAQRGPLFHDQFQLLNLFDELHCRRQRDLAERNAADDSADGVNLDLHERERSSGLRVSFDSNGTIGSDFAVGLSHSLPEMPSEETDSLDHAVTRVVSHATDRFMSSCERIDVAFEILIERACQGGGARSILHDSSDDDLPLPGSPTPSVVCSRSNVDAAAFHAAAVAIRESLYREAASAAAYQARADSMPACTVCKLRDHPFLRCTECDSAVHTECIGRRSLSRRGGKAWVCDACFDCDTRSKNARSVLKKVCSSCRLTVGGYASTPFVVCLACDATLHLHCSDGVAEPTDKWLCKACTASGALPKRKAGAASPDLPDSKKRRATPPPLFDEERVHDIDDSDTELDESILYPARDTQTYKVIVCMIDLGPEKYHRPVDVTRRCAQRFPNLPPDAANKVLARGLDRYFRKIGSGRGGGAGPARNRGAEYRLRRQFHTVQ